MAPALNGPAASLVSHITHLGNLLRYLLESLPLDPTISSYSFGLDPDDIKDEGVWFALNWNLEISFE